MPLTVLTDEDVRQILLGLTKDDVLNLQQSLADALHYYSTATEDDRNGCCASYQPMRTALKRGDGQTTLFMPASSNEGLGVKIVTLSVPNSDAKASQSPLKSDNGDAAVTSATTSLSSCGLSSSPPVSQKAPSTKSTQSSQPAPSTTPKGTLQILDKDGAARGFMNAEEITAFRTALASTMMFKKRHNVHDVLVFGAGKQAYWHIRLALLLRGPEVHHLTVVNRSYDTAKNMLGTLFAEGEGAHAEGKEIGGMHHRPKIQILTPSAREYERLLKTAVRDSCVIFCCTPALSPLFPAEYLTSAEGRRKGRYISAIGSYKPHMVEIHPDILRQNVAKPESGRHHFHKHARTGGAIVVDSVEACLKEAGEVIQAGLTGHELVELGELIMLRRDAERRRTEAARRKARSESASDPEGTSSTGSIGSSDGLDDNGVELRDPGKKSKWFGHKKSASKSSSVQEQEIDKALAEEEKTEHTLRDWLQRGNVIYKSVGLGLMDVVVGADLIRLADERGVGTRIQNF